jgi:hypothetical protein
VVRQRKLRLKAKMSWMKSEIYRNYPTIE